MTPTGGSTSWREVLTADEAAAVAAVAAAAEAVDGVGPLSEQTRLRLRPGAPPGRHLLAWLDGSVAGYASLDEAEPGSEPEPGAQAEVVVAPAHRRRGAGTALVAEVVRAATATAAGAPTTLGVWAHGDSRAAAALAARTGFTRDRVLWQMAMPLSDSPLPDRPPGERPPVETGPEPALPAGIQLRAFVPGRDEEAWLRVNAEAFAHHPEQGRWTAADLAAREAEPWFEPAGFLLAERDGELVGFHWTKVHETPAGPVGEVYVVGVRPAAAGGGLGRALTLAGLAHLRRRGIPTVMLYVDDDNAAAMRLYAKIGFRPATADVSYTRSIGG